MKVLDEDKVKWDKLEYPVVMSIKLDGVYCYSTYSKEENKVTLLSRTNKPIVCNHLLGELKKVHKQTQCDLIIGELIISGKDFDYTSGVIRKKVQTKEKEDVVMFIHDCYNKDCFQERYKILANVLAPRNAISAPFYRVKDFQYLIMVGQKFMYSKEEIYDYFDKLVKNSKEEGIVIRNPKALYQQGKRNNDMFKLKRKCSFTLKIVDFFKGKKGSKYENTIGGLVLEDAKETKIKAGSGLSDANRTYMLSNFADYKNSFVEVEAMGVTSTGNLRMPRIKGFRDDKVEADIIKGV